MPLKTVSNRISARTSATKSDSEGVSPRKKATRSPPSGKQSQANKTKAGDAVNRTAKSRNAASKRSDGSDKPSLTRRQSAVFAFIRDKIQNRGYGPTVREIGEHFQISSPNGVMCHLKALEKKGLITREPNMSRAIQLADHVKRETTDDLQQLEGMRRVSESTARLPMVGRVAAGVLHEAIEQSEEVDFAEMFCKQDQFALEVHGDSMIEAQIADGDFVVVRRQATASDGQMVVARTDDGEATLKYWHPESKRIRLQPANSNMSPIYVSNAQVLGVVVGVVRQLG